MTLHEYIAGIEKVSGQPVGPEGSPHWLRLAERYAETLKAIQERTPNLMEQGIQFPENRVSRALFTAETGIVLPKTQRDSVRVLTGYVGADRVAEAERVKEQAEADERAERERRRIWYIVERFRGGATITGAELVDAARACGAKPHPRTVGMVVKKVAGINRDGYGTYRGDLNADTVADLVVSVVRPTATQDDRHADAATQAVAESLFQPGGTLFAAAS